MKKEIKYRKAIPTDCAPILALLKTFYQEEGIEYPPVDEADAML